MVNVKMPLPVSSLFEVDVLIDVVSCFYCTLSIALARAFTQSSHLSHLPAGRQVYTFISLVS